MPDIDTECLACGGPLELLGVLGTLQHYRCRNCGCNTSFETTPPPQKEKRQRERTNIQ